MSAKEILEKIVGIFNTGDVSEVESLFADTYIDHQKPDFIKVDGPKEFKQIVELARKSLSGLKVTIEDTISEENKITARLHWLGVNSQGNKVHRETIDILLFENGKAVEHWGAEAWQTTEA